MTDPGEAMHVPLDKEPECFDVEWIPVFGGHFCFGFKIVYAQLHGQVEVMQEVATEN